MTDSHLASNQLSFSDLKNMSGYKQKIKVIEWLEAQSIPYSLNRNGQPITSWFLYNKSKINHQHSSKDEEIHFL